MNSAAQWLLSVERKPIMGLYSRFVFPRLCDWMMRDPRLAPLRSEILAGVEQDVLEIGFGTGLNLEHYPEGVLRITTVDPAPEMAQIAHTRIQQSRIQVDSRSQSAEELPFDDQSFACVVSTWTLCSIPDVAKGLSEVYRVLKSGGRFLFLEHGKSADSHIQKWQRRLNPIQRAIGGGCRLDLDVGAIVRGQPFESVVVDCFELDHAPRTHGTMYRGVAIK
jgi:SAM-dependent methyltransferase